MLVLTGETCEIWYHANMSNNTDKTTQTLTVELHENNAGHLAIVCPERNIAYLELGEPDGSFRDYAEALAARQDIGEWTLPRVPVSDVTAVVGWALVADWHSVDCSINLHGRPGVAALQFVGGEGAD